MKTFDPEVPPGLRGLAFRQRAREREARQRRQPADTLAMQCTHLDGSPIADAEAMREAAWRHLVVTPWRRGDVLAIDNDAVSHGRLPCSGPREVAVAWA
jgi:hypothetical protein